MNLNPLPKDVSSLLQQEALAVDDEMAAAKARVRAKLAETLGAAAMAESLQRTHVENLREAASASGTAFLKGKVLLATVAFAAGGLTGAGIHALAVKDSLQRPLRQAQGERGGNQVQGEANAVQGEPVEPLPQLRPLRKAQGERAERQSQVEANTVQGEPVEPLPQLRPLRQAQGERGERQVPGKQGGAWLLLNQARTALSRGQPEEALASLKRHAEKFPKGEWTEEREALRVQALVAAGKAVEAHEAGRRFLTTYPESLFKGMVEAAMSEATP